MLYTDTKNYTAAEVGPLLREMNLTKLVSMCVLRLLLLLLE